MRKSLSRAHPWRARGARTLVSSLAATACLVGSLLPALAQTTSEPVEPTGRIYNPDGSLAGFSTNEPNVFLLAPSSWQLFDRGSGPSAVLTPVSGSADTYDLQLALSAEYGHAAPAVAEILSHTPEAFFFPLPLTVKGVSLFLPPELGSLVAELIPGEGVQSPVAIYYRLRLTSSQVDVFRVLAQSPLALQGAIELSYQGGSEDFETAVPLTIAIGAEVFEPTDERPTSPIEWLDDLLRVTHLRLRGALDGAYALGGGISLTLEDTSVEAEFVDGQYELVSGMPTVVVARPIGEEGNLSGIIELYVRELALSVSIDYEARIEISLNLLTVAVIVEELDIVDAEVNGTESSFYRQLLQQLVTRPDVRDALSQGLTEELQRRILSETLIGIDVGAP